MTTQQAAQQEEMEPREEYPEEPQDDVVNRPPGFCPCGPEQQPDFYPG